MKIILNGIFIIFLLVIFTFSLNDGYIYAKAENIEKETVYIKAGHMKYVDEFIEFSDGVEIKKDENVMKAPSGNYDKENKKIFLEDNVKVNYNKGNVESQIMTGWLNDNKYIFEKNVILNHILSEDKTFLLKAPYLEMLSNTNSFMAKDGVVINHEERVIKALTADYVDKTEILKLSGDVYIKEDGDWIKSDKAEFNLGTENEEFTADGNVELELDL